MEQDVHWVRRNQSCLSSKRKMSAITPIGAERILEHPDIERLKTENKKLSEKRKKLEADLKKSRAEVQKLRNSKSWKVTAPLRAVMRLFGKD